MRKEQLTAIIAQRDQILARAVRGMIDYVQDKYRPRLPMKSQTEAVNEYLRSVNADGDGEMDEHTIAHRKIATREITISAINVLDKDELDHMQKILDHIAADKCYHMPERKRGMRI